MPDFRPLTGTSQSENCKLGAGSDLHLESPEGGVPGFRPLTGTSQSENCELGLAVTSTEKLSLAELHPCWRR